MATKKAKRKPRESFGQVEKLPSGRWRARYTAPNGERFNAPKTFDNMTDARGWLAIQQAAIVSGEWSLADAESLATSKAARADTLGDYAATWLNTRVNRHGESLRPRTHAEYERLIEGALDPFMTKRIKAITPAMVRDWFAEQTSSGKKTQASRAYGLLKAILATAVDDEMIQQNPCRIRGAMSTSSGREVKPPTAEELKVIVQEITPRYRAMVQIAAWAGLRYGELTELRRKDLTVLDDELVMVRVARAVVHTTREGFRVGEPKTRAGIRAVALPAHVTDDVVTHLRQYTDLGAEALLFPAADRHTHLAASTWAKHWYPARAAAGREDLPFHGLRHFGATRYAMTGATIRELQARLGHTSSSAAMRYQHSAGRDLELTRRMTEGM